MRQVIGLFEQTIAAGVKSGEFAKRDARAQARLIVARLEGAILMTNLYKDDSYMWRWLDHLEQSVQRGFCNRPLPLLEEA
jgi:hypothetical protein